YYDSAHAALVCYKGDRYFLLGSEPHLDGYAVGTKGTPHLQGTWRDAEDGALSGNPVASGFVDATLMVQLTVPAGGEASSYVWPRDAAVVAEALDLAGYHEAPRQSYVFLRRLLAQSNHVVNGYVLHRYTPAGMVAASWHASVGDGRLRLPIQEDGTALAVY